MTMKLLCGILLLLPGLLPWSVSAQDFQAGIKAALCASQVSGDRLSGFDKGGFAAGFFVRRELSDNLALQLEIQFIQKGSRKPLNQDDNTYYRMRLHYAEVPLLFRYRPGKKWTFEAGAAYGSLVFAQEDNELGEIQGTPPFKKYELSWIVGMDYPLAEYLLFNIRYNHSITPVRSFEGGYNYNYWDRGQYNSVLQAGFYWSF
jgi:hypothetical protein